MEKLDGCESFLFIAMRNVFLHRKIVKFNCIFKNDPPSRGCRTSGHFLQLVPVACVYRKLSKAFQAFCKPKKYGKVKTLY